MNQTFWITPSYSIINCPPNGHYNYIKQNFVNLFGKQPLNESEVHDYPYNSGWVHVQNHFKTFNVRGNQSAISGKKNIIRDLIFERLLTERNFTVNIEFNNKANVNPFGQSYSFSMPDDYDKLKSMLS